MPEVNYMPNPASAYVPPTVFHSDSTMAAAGSPEGVYIGWPGAMYVDTDDGTLYKKVSGMGTNTGWEEHTGGAGSDPQVFSSASSDPSADPGVSSAVHFRRDDGSVWFWNDTTAAWVKVIG